MCDSDSDTVSIGEVLVDPFIEEENSIQVVEDIVPHKVLERKRTQTAFFVAETSQQAAEAAEASGIASSRKSRKVSNFEASDDGEDGYVEDQILNFMGNGTPSPSTLRTPTPDGPPVEMACADDVSHTSDFLPSSKVKATQESVGIPEDMKLLQLGSGKTVLCVRIFSRCFALWCVTG